MASMARTLNAAIHTVRRGAFVEAAQRLMQAKGFEQMSVQDVLDELDASRGAFYHYFDSKQALLEAVVDRMVDACLAAVAPVVEDPDLAAIPKVEQLFSGIGQWKTDRKALVLALLKVWISDDNAIVREKFRRTAVARLTPVLARIVEQGVVEGTFVCTAAAETARILVMLLLGFQDLATDLFIAREANTITFEDVKRTFPSYGEAFERILGVPAGSIRLIDETILLEWYG
jgi:AcrR family transcriptional regulator